MVHELQRVLRYGVILGLVPFSDRPRHQRCQKLLTIGVLMLNLVTVIFVLIYRIRDELVVSAFVSVVVFFNQRLAAAIIHLEVMQTYGKHFDFVEKSQRIQRLFRKNLNLCICLRSLQRSQRKKYLAYLVVVFGCLLIFMVLIVVFDYYGYFWHSLPAIFILRIRCLQAIIYLNYINHYMEMLNMKLRAVVSSRTASKRGLLDVNYERLESLEYLLKLKELYGELYQYRVCFNDLLGWSMFVMIAVTFADIIVNSYWMFLTLAGFYNMYFVAHNVVTIVPLLFMVSMLCYDSEQCKRQGQETSSLVQRLLRTSSQDTNVCCYNDLLNEWSIQIKHQPITICGTEFFCVDLQLLMSFFSAIVTYMVILLQFRVTVV